jgi:hypothetical protein
MVHIVRDLGHELKKAVDEFLDDNGDSDGRER